VLFEKTVDIGGTGACSGLGEQTTWPDWHHSYGKYNRCYRNEAEIDTILTIKVAGSEVKSGERERATHGSTLSLGHSFVARLISLHFLLFLLSEGDLKACR